MQTSEVLHKAADLIEERGWTRGSGGWDKTPGSPLCLEGGIQAAIGLHDDDRGRLYSGCPAYDAVQRHLDDRGFSYAFMWNDRPNRTATEVIEVLRAAALVEAAREDAALLAEAGRV